MTKPPKSPHSRGGRIAGVPSRTLVVGGIVVLSVWFVLANTASATIRFWIPTLVAPMWIVLAGTFAAGTVTGWYLKGRRY